jgi:hypothetical protein
MHTADAQSEEWKSNQAWRQARVPGGVRVCHHLNSCTTLQCCVVYLQAFAVLVEGLRLVVSSTRNPWLHMLLAWALSQQLAVLMISHEASEVNNSFQ